MAFSEHSRTLTRLLASGAIIVGGLLGAALFGGVPSALADQDPAADPPNCTAADLEGVRAGVSARRRRPTCSPTRTSTGS